LAGKIPIPLRLDYNYKGKKGLLSLDFRSILTSSTQETEQVQDRHDEQDRPHYPQASASPPSGIPLIAAACAEQQQQNNN
jgi:hypothetical protein